MISNLIREKMSMKQGLIMIIFLIFSFSLQAQKEQGVIYRTPAEKRAMDNNPAGMITLYPVPVRGNTLNIKCEKEISFIKVTNIIGQDIFKEKFNNPLTLTKIDLNDPARGMYLVTIIFNDGVKVVKKIMIEPSE